MLIKTLGIILHTDTISLLINIWLARLLESSTKSNSISTMFELYKVSQLTTNTTSTLHFSSYERCKPIQYVPTTSSST